MAELASMLIEIARNKGYDDGADTVKMAKRGPIKMEERTIQVKRCRTYCTATVRTVYAITSAVLGSFLVFSCVFFCFLDASLHCHDHN